MFTEFKVSHNLPSKCNNIKTIVQITVFWVCTSVVCTLILTFWRKMLSPFSSETSVLLHGVISLDDYIVYNPSLENLKSYK
jgi:hypothetical protein